MPMTKLMPSSRRRLGNVARSLVAFLTMSLLTVALAGCVTDLIGRTAGKQIGRALAKAPPTKVVVQPKGGSFCGVVGAMGGPFKVDPSDTRPTREVITGLDEHGEAHCGWKP